MSPQSEEKPMEQLEDRENIISGAAELSINVRKCDSPGGQLSPVAQLHSCSTTAYGLLGPGVTELDPDVLESLHRAADTVDRPIETELLRGARAKGCVVLDDGRIEVGQAADAFLIFTGLEPDPERMRSQFLEIVAAEEVAA